MAKYLGLIGYKANDRGERVPLVDSYGSVLIFKSKEDAVSMGATSVDRTVTALMPRKKAPQSPKPGEPV